MNRLHPLSAAMMAFGRGVSGAFLAFVLLTVLAAVFEAVRTGWATLLVPIGFAIGFAYGVAYYYRFGYELTDDTFDIASGVVARRDREIPFRRVQNVDVRQGVVYRLFGLAVVNVETAGGGDTEAVLNFVGEDEAKRLQREIRRRTAESKANRRERTDADDERAAVEEPPADTAVDGEPEASVDDRRDVPPEDEPVGEPEADARWDDHRPTTLFALEARALLLYSLASFRIAAAAGVLFLAFLVGDVALEFLVTVAQPVGGPETIEAGTPRSYAILTLVSLVHGLVLTYLLGAGYTFVSYYDFTLGRVGDDLVYERGLLQSYSGSVPVEKVQSVTVTDNPLQRLIGYAGLWVETAGYGPDSGSGSQSAVPLARRGRVYGFAERFTGLERPTFSRPTTVARRRYLARYSIVAAVIVAAAYGITRVTVLESWFYAAVVFLAVPPAAHLRWVNLGYYVGEDHLVIRAGFWKRQTTVIPYYRVQTVNTRRSIFQRRLGLASLVVDTASSQTFFRGTPTIYDVDLEVARGMHEESRDRLQVALRDRAESDSDGRIEFA
ncbi:PH domain-containing protein [Natrialbaceae archaeon AArc-T1-2]|uniref:PH domain-containing protein n=1 Tax=Natrialbaceae archaeon AArc-T1-2 TaxID=3053904 RepID=UPI00255A8BA9|nr:PH domain-containing protein [Natrialbaceae archaeon AArc-T1-2]WIV66103.1 PH domain-containing protein [Natrialbaceae archaeon AArc-T1-2]